MADTTVIRTILFADVRDSVAIYERRGDDEASRLILTLIERFKRTIANYHGSVVKVTGDGVMAVFDQPDQGILAASEMIALADEVIVGVGIGLDHGNAVSQGGDYYGTTVNVAARIMALARGGEILMTQGVVDQLSPATGKLTRLIDRASIKGLSNPVNIHSLVTFDDSATIFSGARGQHDVANQLGLTLVHGDQEVCFSPRMGRLEIGRLGDRDLTVQGEHVSRNHATISYSGDAFSIADHSTNGTFLSAQAGECLALRRSSAPLMASGQIGLGRAPSPGYEAIVSFRVHLLAADT